MQNQITWQENMTTYFDNLTINFNLYDRIKNPNMRKPEKFFKFTYQKDSSSDKETIYI